MSDIKISYSAGTNVGLMRENNEDSFVTSELGPYGVLLVVADGMGGANAGEVASGIAVETVKKQFEPQGLAETVGDEKRILEFMRESVCLANSNVQQRSLDDPSTRGMGTTIVMAWILGDLAYVCWCGDSRAYLMNKRRGLVRLTKDHSYVQDLVDRGVLSAEEMQYHPLSHIITRCLGDDCGSARPETSVCHLSDGDVLMLCSDGLCGLCSDAEISEVMASHGDSPETCRDSLISAALNNGGHDNVTVAVAGVRTDRRHSFVARIMKRLKRVR